jgi:hypothetical protein
MLYKQGFLGFKATVFASTRIDFQANVFVPKTFA